MKLKSTKLSVNVGISRNLPKDLPDFICPNGSSFSVFYSTWDVQLWTWHKASQQRLCDTTISKVHLHSNENCLNYLAIYDSWLSIKRPYSIKRFDRIFLRKSNLIGPVL